MKIFLTNGLGYYLAAVTALAIVIAFFLARRLSRLEKTRQKRLSKVKRSEILASHINRHLNAAKLKQQRLISLKNRFTVTKRAIYFGLIIILALAIITPLIGSTHPTMISVVVGCFTVVFGIAAKPFIENLICGLVLCFGKLARIGDIVLVDGEYGSIEDVTLTHCIIRRWDWLRYVVPNSKMMTKEFLNYSLRDNHRWVYVEFSIEHNQDLELIEKLVMDSPKDSKYYSPNEDPRFWITDLTPEHAKCMVVAWATTAADGWMLSIDIRKKLLKSFQQHGIKTHLRNIAFDQTATKNDTEVRFDNS